MQLYPFETSAAMGPLWELARGMERRTRRSLAGQDYLIKGSEAGHRWEWDDDQQQQLQEEEPKPGRTDAQVGQRAGLLWPLLSKRERAYRVQPEGVMMPRQQETAAVVKVRRRT